MENSIDFSNFSVREYQPLFRRIILLARGKSRDFERLALYVDHHGHHRGRKFQFLDGLKCQNGIRNYKFLTKYFYQYFQILSIFTYNKNFMMKFYQLRFYKCFYKEREKKNTHTAVSENRKTVENLTLFIIKLFIKPFKMIILFPAIGLLIQRIYICIYFYKLACSTIFNFGVRMIQRNIKKGKQGMANCWEWQIGIFFSKTMSIFR